MVGFGHGKGSTEPRKIETSSLGNMLLILGGVKTRFVGLQTPVERGELVYITSGDQKIPVIVDTVENDRLLRTIPWHQAGHLSTEAYLARLRGDVPLHAVSAAADSAVDNAVMVNEAHNGRARTFTFHVATRDELVEKLGNDLKVREATAGAQAVISAYNAAGNQQPQAVNDAFEFADKIGVSQNQLLENVSLATSNMRGQKSGPAQHG